MLAGKNLCKATGQSTTLEKQLAELDVDAFLLMKHGKIVCEEYFHGMTPDTPHETFSMIKSITATVIATLLADGSLHEEGLIEEYVPETIWYCIRGSNSATVARYGVWHQYKGSWRRRRLLAMIAATVIGMPSC